MEIIPSELVLCIGGYCDYDSLINMNVSSTFINKTNILRLGINELFSRRLNSSITFTTILSRTTRTMASRNFIDEYQFLSLREQLHEMLYIVTGLRYKASNYYNYLQKEEEMVNNVNVVNVAKNIYNTTLGTYIKLRHRNLLAYI